MRFRLAVLLKNGFPFFRTELILLGRVTMQTNPRVLREFPDLYHSLFDVRLWVSQHVKHAPYEASPRALR